MGKSNGAGMGREAEVFRLGLIGAPTASTWLGTTFNIERKRMQMSFPLRCIRYKLSSQKPFFKTSLRILRDFSMSLE